MPTNTDRGIEQLRTRIEAAETRAINLLESIKDPKLRSHASVPSVMLSGLRDELSQEHLEAYDTPHSINELLENVERRLDAVRHDLTYLEGLPADARAFSPKR